MGCYGKGVVMIREAAKSEIRRLCPLWAATQSEDEMKEPRFFQFVQWLKDNGFGSVLTFRSTMGAMEDAERWFDEVFKQGWRN